MAIFTLAVYGAPYSSQASYSALRFAQSALQQNHQIYRVFFYHDGVHNASSLSTPPQDELALTDQWQLLHETHGVDLVVCIAAALKRGLLDESEAKRYRKTAINVSSAFTISGLGQLLDGAVEADRLITFGG